ncbi:hypothetical protein EK904_003640 [Melospiza melodia maxima]|nr:hypothetical protein EK904_003640 [Melospiza melodia maxima]
MMISDAEKEEEEKKQAVLRVTKEKLNYLGFHLCQQELRALSRTPEGLKTENFNYGKFCCVAKAKSKLQRNGSVNPIILSQMFMGSFPLLLNAPLPCLGTDCWVLSFPAAVTAAGGTGIVPVSPYHSTLTLVRSEEKHVSTFFEAAEQTSFMLHPFACWRMKCPINLSLSTI